MIWTTSKAKKEDGLRVINELVSRMVTSVPIEGPRYLFVELFHVIKYHLGSSLLWYIVTDFGIVMMLSFVSFSLR